MGNQLDFVTEKPIRVLRLQGLACDWSKHNEHSRNIFSVHGFLSLSVSGGGQSPFAKPKSILVVFTCTKRKPNQYSLTMADQIPKVLLTKN